MLIRLLFLSAISLQTQAELYRCELDNGQTQYTYQPCPETGEVYQPQAVMTNYKTINPPTSHNEKSSPMEIKSNNQCPFVSSTELRTLRVKDEYKKGLTQSHIEKRLGKADDTNNNKNKSQWVYSGKNVKRIFRFKDGCLMSWKETWKGKESKISKYRDVR